MQWTARTNLFEAADGQPVDMLSSTDPNLPYLLTSLTYQSVTMPRRDGRHLEQAVDELWINTLLDKGQAETREESEIWIHD